MGRESSIVGGLTRITGPVAFFSAFLNNAPIVAMMTPAVLDWAKRVEFRYIEHSSERTEKKSSKIAKRSLNLYNEEAGIQRRHPLNG